MLNFLASCGVFFKAIEFFLLAFYLNTTLSYAHFTSSDNLLGLFCNGLIRVTVANISLNLPVQILHLLSHVE